MPVAVPEGGAAACLRGAGVLGFLRWIVALFRFPQPSPRGGDPAAVPVALEPDVERTTTPSHLMQPAPELGWATSQAPPERGVWPHEDGDHDSDMVPAGPAPAVSGKIIETVEPVQDVPASFSDNPPDSDDGAPVLLGAAGMEKAGLVAEGDGFPALAVENGGAIDAGDEPEPGPHAPSDHIHGSTKPGEPDLPVLPTLAASEARAIVEEPAPLPTSGAPAGETGAEGPVEAWTPVPDPSRAPAPTGQSSIPAGGLSATLADSPEPPPDDGLADEPARASNAPRTAGRADAGGDPAVGEGATCADAAITAEGPAERETVGACDGGTIGGESVDRPGETGEPDERWEAAEEQSGAGLSTEDANHDPGIVAEADADHLQPARPLHAEEAGEIGEARPQSEHGIDADVAIHHASGAAELLPMQVDPAESGSSVFGEPAAGVGPDGASLPDAVAAALMRRPGEYRPRLKRARTRRAPAADSAGSGDIQNLSADLLLLIGAADWGVQLSALLRMPAGAEDEVAIDQGGEETWLGQLDDQLLEPLALTDASSAFGEPLLVTAVGLPVRWSRTSRDLHVLGPHTRVAGFASQARVVIGQESVVICREGLADAARAQILATGSADPIQIEGPNVPSGWVCWRGVRPVRPSSPVGGQSILDALDPLPAVSIELSGGIQLSRAVWLEGHPPSIRLLGLLSEADPVLIDGTPASPGGDGGWTAEGWEAPGSHAIHHGGKSASYAIQPGAGAWDWWPAWEGATRLAGALSDAGGRQYFYHARSAALLGAQPGQICGFVPSAFGIGVARPDFEPVWLLTAGSGSRRGSASMVGSAPTPGAPVGSREAVERWVRAVCASGRAGAKRSEERAAWSGYVAVARSHRKRRQVNELLLWMSAIGSGSEAAFRRRAAELLPARRAGPSAYGRAVWSLGGLAHCEFGEVASWGWRVAPPVIAAGDPAGPVSAVLCGARSAPLVARLAAAAGDGMTIAPQREAPDAVILSASAAGDLLRVSRETGIPIQWNAALAILSAFAPPPLASFEETTVPRGGWAVERFSQSKAAWLPSSVDEAGRAPRGLFRFKSDYDLRHIYRQGTVTRAVPPGLAKYWLLGRRQRAMRLDLPRGQVSFPLAARPPGLIDRALVVASGTLPVVADGRLTYSGITAPVAAATAAALRAIAIGADS